MKKLHVFFFILLIASGLVFAEDVKVKTGDVITVCRFPDITKDVQLKVKSVKWNEAILEVIE